MILLGPLKKKIDLNKLINYSKWMTHINNGLGIYIRDYFYVMRSCDKILVYGIDRCTLIQ